MLRRTLFTILATLTLTDFGQAHPAHAEEVEHPFVAGFERFYSDADADDYLARGGELLLNELNCVACHLGGDRLPGVPGPHLTGVGSRISDGAAMSLLIRNPRFLKRGTTMPSLFAASDRDPEELDALLHFLASLREEPGQQLLLAGDAERGQKLYHETGCVACHAPDVAFRPADMPDALRLEFPALPSSPIRLATAWSADFLTRFLVDPIERHPSGRMPSLGLAEQEAADISAYLQATTPAAASTSEVFQIAMPEPEPDLVKTGAALFSSKGCAACHDAGSGYDPRPAPALARLAENLGNGCLADKPVEGGIPHYFLSELQKKAIRLALTKPPDPPDSPLEIELVRRDCFACHSFGGRGGPELAREPYFGAFDPRALDKESFLPPTLDGVGERHSSQQLLEIFAGKAERRHPRVGARMIVMPEASATRLTEWLLDQR